MKVLSSGIQPFDGAIGTCDNCGCTVQLESKDKALIDWTIVHRNERYGGHWYINCPSCKRKIRCTHPDESEE